jgi:hypothetical protein
MGLRAMHLELLNCGTGLYTVNGYPAVRVLDDDRNPLEVTVINGSSSIALIDGFDTTPKPLTLKPGDMAAAGVVWKNTVTDSTVSATNGAFLEVTPAAGQSPQTVTPDGSIDLGTTGKLGVTAWALPKQQS